MGGMRVIAIGNQHFAAMAGAGNGRKNPRMQQLTFKHDKLLGGDKLFPATAILPDDVQNIVGKPFDLATV